MAASKSSAFLVLGPLSPDPGDIDSVLLLPTVRMKNTQESAYLKTSTITCQIPSVQAKVRQETFEGLQFFADDLTHWLDGAFGDGSRPKPRDELKMIGSRFFGSKASSSTSSSMIEEDDDEATSATVIRVQITETDVALHVPRSGMAGQERTLSLKASDLSATVESNTSGRQETAIILTIMDAEFADRSDAIPKRILGRTTPLTLTLQNHPIVHLRFSSLANKATGTKETSIKAVLSSFTISVQPDLSWIQDLAAFAKTPEGVFEDVVPSEITRIALEVYDGSIHVTPPTMPGAAVVVLGILQVKTDLVSDAEENTIDISLGRTALLLVDDVGSTVALSPGKAAAETWKVRNAFLLHRPI
jgi:autophagy-related protein 2